MEVDDAQPVQEVLAELAGGDEVVQVAIGGGDHANVDSACDWSEPTAWSLAVLEKPQQPRLHAQDHVADFVEKQRTAMREPELAALLGKVPVMFPLTCPKSSDSRRASVRPAQFTATNGASLRLEWLWMYRATRSLPTPLSPVIRTVAGLFAAPSAMASSSVIARLATTKTGLLRRSTDIRWGF